MSGPALRLAARAALRLAALWWCLLGWAAPCVAHPSADFSLRVVHFVPTGDGMMAYYRISLPLLLAPRTPPDTPDTVTILTKATTFDRLESGRLFHYLEPLAAAASQDALGALLISGHHLNVHGQPVTGELLALRIHPRGFVPTFTTLAEAEAAFNGPVYPANVPEMEAKYVLIDAAIRYRFVPPAGEFQFAGAGISQDGEISNILFLHTDNEILTYTYPGTLAQPATLGTSMSQAVAAYCLAGARHILQGWDHLLFILCLVIGDPRPRALIARITAFSIGHSLSLAAGFYGVIPTAAWFQPWIEVTIALSLLCAALLVIRRTHAAPMTLLLAALVGLVHGFGFAFGLRELLSASSYHILPSLLAFNLGVESGQIAVALLGWWLLVTVRRYHHLWYETLRTGIACCSAFVALAWVVQRALLAFAVS